MTTPTTTGSTPTAIVTTACPGDCDGNQAVTVDELVRGIDIALSGLPVDACASLDIGGDGTVGIDEIVAAVDAALRGCPAA